jgi:hypothetical protein
MTVTAETEVRELRELILGMREEMRIGFVQMDTKIVEVKSEIQRVEFEMKAEIQRVEAKTDIKFAELDGKIDGVRVELNGKIDEARAELNGKIDEVRAELNGKIDGVRAELGGKIDVLDERTKVGFWGFIGRAVIIGIIGGGLAFGAKFFFTGELTF